MVRVKQADYCRHLRSGHVVEQVLFNFNVAIIVAEVAHMNRCASCRQIQQPIEIVLVGVRGVEHAVEETQFSIQIQRETGREFGCVT